MLAMIPVTDLRAGRAFQINGTPYQVTNYLHVKVGRGNATIKVTSRNLKTGSIEEKTFNSGATVEPISTLKKKMQFLYKTPLAASFMDPQTFEQIDVKTQILGKTLNFLKEGELADLLIWSKDDQEVLSVELPPKIALEVKDTPPGVKGNSASNVYKDAILENGLTVKVPLFIKPGEKVLVDTRSGEYIERASKLKP